MKFIAKLTESHHKIFGKYSELFLVFTDGFLKISNDVTQSLYKLFSAGIVFFLAGGVIFVVGLLLF